MFNLCWQIPSTTEFSYRKNPVYVFFFFFLDLLDCSGRFLLTHNLLSPFLFLNNVHCKTSFCFIVRYYVFLKKQLSFLTRYSSEQFFVLHRSWVHQGISTTVKKRNYPRVIRQYILSHYNRCSGTKIRGQWGEDRIWSVHMYVCGVGRGRWKSPIRPKDSSERRFSITRLVGCPSDITWTVKTRDNFYLTIN